MNLNASIIKDYCQLPLSQTFLGRPRLERPLKQIAFYSPQKHLTSDQVYLVDYEISSLDFTTLSNYSFICRTDERIPDPSVPIDLLVISKAFDLFSIFEEILRIFSIFSDLEIKLLTLLSENATLKQLGDCILPYLFNPIALYTPSLRIVFFSERKKKKSQRLFTNEDINTYLPDEDIDALKFDPIFRETIGTIDPSIFPSDMWGYRILYYNIRITGVYVARVMLCETDRPLQDSDYSLLVFISDFLKTAMEKQSFSMNNHPKDLDLCFNQMLNRETINPTLLEKTLINLNWKISDSYFCCVINTNNYDQEIHTISTLCSRLESNYSDSIAIQQKENIVLVINLTKNHKKREEIISSLVYTLREGLLKAGVSLCFNNFQLLADFYEQALIAIKIGNIYDETLWCYYYENYFLNHLIFRASQDTSTQALCPEGLTRLFKYDLDHHRSFSNTLKIFLQNNMNITKTAQALFIQRATFNYQWKRIQEITQIDFSNFKKRLELQIVFQIIDQRQSSPHLNPD